MTKILFDIKAFPELPPEIKQASENGRLAIFIGAGISRFVGCTSWITLANNLIGRCEKEGLINHFENDMLSKDYDMKKTITICNQILSGNDGFMEEMRKSLNDEVVDKYKNGRLNSDEELAFEQNLQIYKDLFSLNGLFITTNADRHIDTVYEGANIVYEKKDFSADKVDNNKLYKIHGSIVNEKSLVFTVDQYIDAYLNKEFGLFIEEIFTKYTVLFIGYGLGEFELLDYLIKTTKGKTKRHFFLKDYFQHEDRIYEFEQLYFDKIGITLIPYKKDKKGFNQLKDIVKDWVEEIKESTTVLQKNFNDLDDALENPE